MNYLREIARSKVGFEIANTIRGYTGKEASTEGIVIAAYLLYEAGKQDKPMSFQDILKGKLEVEKEVLAIGKGFLTEDIWNSLVNANYSQADLRNVVLYYSADSFTKEYSVPSSLVELAEIILRVTSGNAVADIRCGYGSFITDTLWKCAEADIYGFDSDFFANIVASLRAKLLGEQVRIYPCDAISLMDPMNKELIPEDRFNKVFACCPFGSRAKDYQDKPGAQRLFERFPGLRKTGSAEWLFIATAAELLSLRGKAVCITANGCLWNAQDKDIRKQLAEMGFIESVIALPSKMFLSLSIPVSMVVLSRGNTSVRMIDASGYYLPGRRQNTFTAEHLDAIEDAYLGDSEDSVKVSLKELAKNDYCLYPERYTQQGDSVEDGVPFSEIIRDMSRGAQVAARDLDDMASSEPTQYRYLSASSIHDGMVDEELPYLKEIPLKQERYCVRDGALVLAKIGYPFKVALVQAEEDDHILANGNLYIVDVDQNKADPIYIKAYLESEAGQAQLKSVASGMAVASIGAEALKKIVIPLPPMEQQRKVRDTYLETQREIKDLRHRLEEARSKLSGLFSKK